MWGYFGLCRFRGVDVPVGCEGVGIVEDSNI